jgi:hypothetical protein
MLIPTNAPRPATATASENLGYVSMNRTQVENWKLESPYF